MIRTKIQNRYKQTMRASRRFLVDKVLHADDPPHKLALGAAIGVFVTFTPTVGFQMVLNVFLAWLFRANKLIGVPIVWISNPATLVPIYGGCYLLGLKMLGGAPMGSGWWSELGSMLTSLSAQWSVDTLGEIMGKFWQIGAPLLVGCLTVAIVLAYPTYYSVYWTVRAYRMKRWGQLIPPRSERRRMEAERAAAERAEAGLADDTTPDSPSDQEAEAEPKAPEVENQAL